MAMPYPAPTPGFDENPFSKGWGPVRKYSCSSSESEGVFGYFPGGVTSKTAKVAIQNIEKYFQIKNVLSRI
jgi:hypothetical protein